MRGQVISTAVALFFAASLTAAAAAPPSAARPASEPATRAARPAPVLVDCFWHARVRPANFMLACGDGNSRLASLHWTAWGRDGARAQGVNWVNDCKPYCAAGRFHAYPVVVRLDHARPWKKHPRLRHYTRMTLVYNAERPRSFPQTVVYPLWD
ncbi:hypothetical protein [Streptomyces sp. CdTB01]|uniref:hypothetical protein n=1 Tax=Streptomyces sp. CdTB01 TaxID=1725411 RepID=UPI00073A74BA|nr:hypothetical protein [Streptomyces sp. CdTB01]ALV31564.1 hypothetical protein AS200_05505 [Streptomyces sp. CdTB01]